MCFCEFPGNALRVAKPVFYTAVASGLCVVHLKKLAVLDFRLAKHPWQHLRFLQGEQERAPEGPAEDGEAARLGAGEARAEANHLEGAGQGRCLPLAVA